MNLRETTTKAAITIVGLAQNPRGKSQVVEKEAAACFQRLASCKVTEPQEEKQSSGLEVDTGVLDESHLGQPATFNVAPLFSTLIAAQNCEVKQTKTVREPVQTDSSKFAGNAEKLTEFTGQRKTGLGQKPIVPFPNHQNVRADKPEAIIDVKQEPITTDRPSEIAPTFAGGLSPVSFPQAQIATLRVSDLPHVTRVQIDQTKRNIAGILTSLELVLEPAELGRITAKIQHAEGRVTLVLSAEHRAIADDLARDSGLLLRVLGDQIPGINKMAVFVQTEAQQAQIFQGQSAGDFPPFDGEHKQSWRAREGDQRVQPAPAKDVQFQTNNATTADIRI
jgi:flagellar hook-length control protein FliK